MRQLHALGATFHADGGCEFRVWAPRADDVSLRLLDPEERIEEMQPEGRGYFACALNDVQPGTRYYYRLNGDTDRPDPVSRHQPEGVHGPSAVVDPHRFQWTDGAWSGHALDEYVIYELHVGTFSPEGTFDGVIPYLDGLRDLGVTMIEIMPVAQFPGSRNWGYDGVGLFAVQDSYGGPDGFRRLIDACHQRGLGVILDVVYNHLGPEGNYLPDFGPYFTDHYQTPWGEAVNVDGPESDHVRHFFLENARYWLREYHVDAFRLDAVHAIYDQSATNILEEYRNTVHREGDRLGRFVAVIAESDLNDPRIIRSTETGGYGHDAQWADDFHHALHALLTGERDGYYVDFGTTRRLVDALRRGYALTGDYSKHRKRQHGRPPEIRDGRRFVVCSQNHDQVGNRATGDRLTASLEFEQLKIAAGATILSPFLPLLFMGEEYAEPNPFQYFVSHGDPDLVEAVRQGRQREFQAFNWQGNVPDPQAESTFQHSKLNHDLKVTTPHAEMMTWYRELLRLRREIPALKQLDLERQDLGAVPGTSVIWILRYHPAGDCLVLINFSANPATFTLALPDLDWECILDSQDATFDGPGMSAEPILLERGAAVVPIEARTLLVYYGRPNSAM